MPQTLTIGSESFDYPLQGETAGYGEEAASWAKAATDALASVQGPNDILATSASLTNNQTTAADIPGFVFNTAEVIGIECEYTFKRIYDSGATTVMESGKIMGHYDGSVFTISIDSIGDAGILFSITNAGQIQYTTTNLTNHTSSTIVFKAKTIDE